VSPTGKSRFTIAPDDPGDETIDPADIRRNRINLSPGERRRRLKPAIIVAGVTLFAVGAILLVTAVIKKPQLFSPKDKDKRVSDDAVFSGGDKAELPDGRYDNTNLRRGIESYRKGYFKDALAEFSEAVESDATDEEKAVALTYSGIIYDEKGEAAKAIELYNRAIRYDRKNPIIYRNLALAYRHKKDYEKAGEAAEKAVDADSKSVKNRILLGNIQFEKGNFKDAAKEFETVLDMESNNPAALYNLGMTLFKKGDEASAIEYFNRAGTADRIGEIARLAYGKLGVIYTERRDYDNAEKFLSLATNIAPKDPVNHYNLGIVYFKQKKDAEALREFLKAEELGKDDANVLEGLGEAYLSLREYDKSLDAYNKLLNTNRRSVKILSRIAEVYYEKGELDRAYDFYHRITTYEPASENARIAYLNMGNILDDTQRYREAIEAYQKALAISPKDDAALFNLGISYKHARKPELAIETWRKAADLNPENPQPLLALADYYYENNHYDLAMDEYQRILRRWPDLQDAHFTLATVYYKRGQNEYAIEEYKRVIEINDRNDYARKAYINLGILESGAPKGGEAGMEKAQNYIQKALVMKPNDAEALLSLGMMYMKKEMYDRAIDTFLQAQRATNDPKMSAETNNNIGKSYYKMGKFKKALQAFTRGIEDDPTNEELRMNRRVAMQAYENEVQRR
jgi:superkiller protein 3